MSRIGRKPVAIPTGVTVSLVSGQIVVKGPKGVLTVDSLPEVTVHIADGAVTVTRKDDSDGARARHGLIRVLIANAVTGVTQGYEKQLEIIGVGYRAKLVGELLVLNLGYSHPVHFAIPVGIEIIQDEKNKNILTVRGISKQLVGQTAAAIRGLRPPEPYKGKGIRYVGEVVRRKPGKAAVAKAVAA